MSKVKRMSCHLVNFLFLLHILLFSQATRSSTVPLGWGLDNDIKWGGVNGCRVGMIQCLQIGFGCGRPFPPGFFEQEMIFMNYWHHAGCKRCQTALSTWTKFSEKCAELKIRIGIMNSTARRLKAAKKYDRANSELMSQITGGYFQFSRVSYATSEIIPTVYYVKDFEFREYVYEGELTVANLVDFVKEEKWKAIKPFKLNVSEVPELAKALVPETHGASSKLQWWHFVLIGISSFLLVFATYNCCYYLCKRKKNRSDRFDSAMESTSRKRKKKKGHSNAIEL